MIDLGAMLRIVSSVNLDPETRQTLLDAARGEGGQEAEAAIETLACALGLIDDEGDADHEAIKELVDQVGAIAPHRAPGEPLAQWYKL
jgi:hypothetical protein